LAADNFHPAPDDRPTPRLADAPALPDTSPGCLRPLARLLLALAERRRKAQQRLRLSDPPPPAGPAEGQGGAP
jgi:hypothetical protein